MAAKSTKIAGEASASSVTPTPVTSGTEVKTKLWYPYAPLAGFECYSVYTGTPVELPEEQAQPANTSQWKPLGDVSSGTHLLYWDPDHEAWRFDPDVSKATIAQLQKVALMDASINLQVAEDTLNGTYPQTERNSWPQQLAEATLILDGMNTATNTPLLTALAAARGIDAKTLAQSVVDKSTAYNTAYAKLLSDYQTVRDKVTDAKVFADLPFIRLDLLCNIPV